MNASKPKNRIPLRVLLPSAVTMLVIALTLIAATYAWQVSNHETGIEASAVESDTVEPQILPYTLYIDVQTPHEDDETGEITYTYEVEVFSDTDDAKLNSYDAILGKNDHSSAYVRMPAYGIASGNTVTFTLSASGTLYRTGTEGNYVYHDSPGTYTQNNVTLNHLMNQYISNIIRVSCANIPLSVIAEDANKDEIYNGAKNWFADHADTVQSDTFVDYYDRPSPREPIVLVEKNHEIEFTLTSSDYTIESDGMVYIYFKIDYEYDLVDAYISALRLDMGGFKIGEAGHAEFSGLVEDSGFDLERIEMTIDD